MSALTDSPIDLFLTAVESGTMESCAVWSPDAVLDATVPHWRFSKHGPDAIREGYSGWFADPGQFEELRRLPIQGGEVVQYLLTWVEDGVSHGSTSHACAAVQDSLIASDAVPCGGRWPASLIAQMQTDQDEQNAHAHA